MNVLDLFAGACGGWSLGLHRAGFNTVAACERDEWRQRQFLRNFPGVRMYDDVRTVTARIMRVDGVGPIDLVCGSPPCQDASTANTSGKGIDGARTGLYLEAVRIVIEIRPRWFAFENVPGIRSRGIDRVLGLLEQGGYTAWPLVVGASDLGATHLRKRSVVIGADATTVQRLAQSWDQPDRNSKRAIADTMQPVSIGRCSDRGRGGGAEGLERSAEPASNANADGIRQSELPGRPETEEANPQERTTRQSRGAGLAFDHGKPGHNGPELSPLERAITARCGARAENWNGGIAGRFGMDDGLPKGMARPLLAAYGDAVAPQLAEVVGRAIIQAEGLR